MSTLFLCDVGASQIRLALVAGVETIAHIRPPDPVSKRRALVFKLTIHRDS